MKLSLECIPCLLSQAVRLARLYLQDEDEQRSMVSRIMEELAGLDHHASAPYAAQKMYRVLRETIKNPDPYQQAKIYYNQEMLKLEEDFYQRIQESPDRLYTGLKLAAAGNIIDFGPGYALSKNSVLKTLAEILPKPYAEDAFLSLKGHLQNSQKLLYLGDNCGEVVFDKVFIRVIKEHYPRLKIDFAARGEPVLNDITEADAYDVGMNHYAQIVNNGTDIPGTVLERCSERFQQIFDQADLVIAKGQGNFESLYGSGQGKTYYIFLCKCNLFISRFGVKQNDIMLIKE